MKILKTMTKAEKATYYAEFKKRIAMGLSKWEAIKWARRVVTYKL